MRPLPKASGHSSKASNSLSKYPRTSLGETKAFFKGIEPQAKSHKGKNGVLLVVGGSQKYHGAPFLAMSAAARFCDLIFFFSPGTGNKNQQIALKIKPKLFEFIGISSGELDKHIKWADCCLVGNGMENGKETKALVLRLLKESKKGGKKLVIDAGALQPCILPYLNGNALLTPHAGEFERVFGKKASVENVTAAAKAHGCNLLVKTPECDIICDFRGNVKLNFTGNAGMTRGGTGDVLAGLAAALSCKNGMFEASCAAAYLNGLAGDALAKKQGMFFLASDLAKQLPLALFNHR